MTRFKRLTDAEAGTLTRAELLDRVEAEQAYWARKRGATTAHRAAKREFSRIMHAYLPLNDAFQAAIDTAEGRRSDYWETRPGDVPAPGLGALSMDDNHRAGLEYGMRLLAREREA